MKKTIINNDFKEEVIYTFFLSKDYGKTFEERNFPMQFVENEVIEVEEGIFENGERFVGRINDNRTTEPVDTIEEVINDLISEWNQERYNKSVIFKL